MVEKDPANPTAQYNLGNALYRNKNNTAAIEAYNNAASATTGKVDKSRAYYNKAVVEQNSKQLPDCIESYKKALRLNPQDEDARLNLQKALLEQKEQQKKKQEEKDKKEEKKPKEQDKKQKQKEEQKKEENKQQQQQSKLTKQDAEEKLKALLQQEKNLQDKLRKVNTATSAKPEKDW